MKVKQISKRQALLEKINIFDVCEALGLSQERVKVAFSNKNERENYFKDPSGHMYNSDMDTLNRLVNKHQPSIYKKNIHFKEFKDAFSSMLSTEAQNQLILKVAEYYFKK